MKTETKLKINVLLVTLLVGCANCADEIPSTLEKCKVEDDECLVRTWNKMTIQAEKSGIPELGLPISDKHFVAKQQISLGSDVISVTLTMENVTVTGMANTIYKTVKGFKKDPKEMSGFELTGFTPFMSIKGQYRGSGKFLLLPVHGSGEAEIQYFNTTFKITVSTKTEVKDGEEYLIPTKVRCDYESDKNHFRLENVLNNKAISDGINKVANDNQKLFSKEINQPTAMSFSKVFKEILSPVFKKYPYRSFFLD